MTEEKQVEKREPLEIIDMLARHWVMREVSIKKDKSPGAQNDKEICDGVTKNMVGGVKREEEFQLALKKWRKKIAERIPFPSEVMGWDVKIPYSSIKSRGSS